MVLSPDTVTWFLLFPAGGASDVSATYPGKIGRVFVWEGLRFMTRISGRIFMFWR